jgi:hypothetical protein
VARLIRARHHAFDTAFFHRPQGTGTTHPGGFEHHNAGSRASAQYYACERLSRSPPASYWALSGLLPRLYNRHDAARLVGDRERRSVAVGWIVVSAVVRDVAKDRLSAVPYGDILDGDIFIVN